MAFLSGASHLGAQQVTVTDFQWASPTEPPTELPRAKSRLRPEYPDEMRRNSETGYATMTLFIDATGDYRLLGQVYGTHQPYVRAVEQALENWRLSPGREDGAAVKAVVSQTVLFNPASAATDGPEAAPRLLQATPVYSAAVPADQSNGLVVDMRLGLGVNGAITSADPVGPVAPKILQAIRRDLGRWRFAPARRAGAPVEAEVVQPVLCLAPLDPQTLLVEPAKTIKQVAPVYPFAMRRYGVQGTVTVAFVVNREGRVVNPVVDNSDNPVFDEPALEAVRKWTYLPARLDGKPVNQRMRQLIAFRIDGGGNSLFSFNANTDQSKLPPELRYDTKPKFVNVQVPVYPTDLRRDRIRGKARANLVIGPGGRIVTVKITQADRPEFGLALAAAAEGFVFDPALKDGKPVPFVFSFEQVFDDRQLPDDEADRLASWEKKHPERIAAGSALDAPVKPVSRRPPIFPVTAPKGVTEGQASVAILIDENGRARLPRIVEASDPSFGYAAVQAISSWWFTPPKKGGKETVTRAVVPFVFHLQEPVPSGSAARKKAPGGVAPPGE